MGLHNIGFAHLLIGRAQDALGDGEAAASLDAAVAGLRKAGRTDTLPLALLARAAHRRRRAAAGETDLIDGIRADLAEVEDIAGEEMRLYLTDLALERARLALDVPVSLRQLGSRPRRGAGADRQGRGPHRRHRLPPPRSRARRAEGPPRRRLSRPPRTSGC